MANELTVQPIAEALVEARGLVSVAARRLGVSRTTLYAWMEREPELKQVLSDARELTTDMAEAALFKAIQSGEAWAVCFYLKTQGKRRGYVERHELSGPDGAGVPVDMTVRFVRPDEEG